MKSIQQNGIKNVICAYRVRPSPAGTGSKIQTDPLRYFSLPAGIIRIKRGSGSAGQEVSTRMTNRTSRPLAVTSGHHSGPNGEQHQVSDHVCRIRVAAPIVASARSRSHKRAARQRRPRVGVIASTLVAEDDLPPGMKRFIEYIGRPWHGLVEQYTFQITADLEKTDDWFDRCTHIVTRTEDPEQLLTLRFDWHRTFVSGRVATRESMQQEIGRAEEKSMAYFEDLAEGSRFDEELIRSAT